MVSKVVLYNFKYQLYILMYKSCSDCSYMNIKKIFEGIIKSYKP